MGSLVQLTLRIRRAARLGYGTAGAVILALYLLFDGFRSSPSGVPTGLQFVGAATWLGLFASRLLARAQAPSGAKLGRIGSFELGLLLLVAAHAALQAGSGLTSPLYPLVYGVVAFVAAFADRWISLLVVSSAIVLELGLHYYTEGQSDIARPASHGLFLVLFGLINHAFTRVEIARVRQVSAQEREEERARVREDARLFRLVAAPTPGSGSDEERLFQSSVEEVHHALFHTLDLLRRSLDLHSCILLLKDETGEELEIAELVTESDDVARGPFRAGEGVVGAVATRGLVMNLEHLKPGYRGLCYYERPAMVSAFLGVPLVERDQIRGVLCVDRVKDVPFSSRDEEVLRSACPQILRTLENERVFVQLERSKSEQTVLYRASQALVAALTEDDVIRAWMAAAAEISPYDFAAVTHYDARSRKHSVRAAVGENAASFEALEFRDNASLTAMVVKNRHYLPYRGEFDSTQQIAFTRKVDPTDMRSLLIMPLVAREDAIGTLAIAAKRAEAFGESIRRAQQVLGNQLAVAISNASSVRRLEELATIDALTGCLNKRAFHDELEKKLASAERFKRHLSLVVLDLDHFKFVNDTYGHATGDLILERLGEILRRAKRETDVVGRFGGEEFCLLCEETDTQGATLLAERVREDLASRVFQTENGRLQVTCSAGIATFPDHASSARGLFDASDRSLYAAKHAGRNQVCALGRG